MNFEQLKLKNLPIEIIFVRKKKETHRKLEMIIYKYIEYRQISLIIIHISNIREII